MSGFSTLFLKEVLRFWKVPLQTLGAPVLTALLYLLIFSHALKNRISVYPDLEIDYATFLVPGLAMMSLLQNSFANTSSSLAQSKMMGSIVFILLTPLSHHAFFAAYISAACLRGLIVASGVIIASMFFVSIPISNIFYILFFGACGGVILGSLGLIAGIWADKFDQVAAFQNFVILPMTFLSGVFYSVESLPPLWQMISHANPFFYLNDGFRAGFFGRSDVPVEISICVVSMASLILSLGCLSLIRSGYKLRG
ncbi:MAG: ABC transporter permease [Proteobacteria bacterium]|nr:ABC transporter permease [Pseudomonadota bacterium]